MKLDATAAALTLMVAACGLSTGPGPAEPTELELAAGEEVAIPGTVYRVGFFGVDEDSRCPVDVVCVWQGNAAVEIGLTAGSGPTQMHVLNTGVEPGSVDFGGLRVNLVGVAPEPHDGVTIPPEDYVVTLGIEPIEP